MATSKKSKEKDDTVISIVSEDETLIFDAEDHLEQATYDEDGNPVTAAEETVSVIPEVKKEEETTESELKIDVSMDMDTEEGSESSSANEEKKESLPDAEGSLLSKASKMFSKNKKNKKSKNTEKKSKKAKEVKKETIEEVKLSGEELRRQQIREMKLEEQKREQEYLEQEEFRSIWASLSSAMKEQTMLRGVISGIEEVSSDAGSQYIFVSLIYQDRLKIMIPFIDLYRDNPVRESVDTSTEEGKRNYLARQKAMAEKLYGLETPFILTHMVRGSSNAIDDYKISASRKKAIEIIEKANFEPNKKTGVARYEVGSDVDATVISVGKFGITASVGGIDTMVSAHQLTFRYISSPEVMKSYYHVGQTIRLHIRDIRINAKGKRSLIVEGHTAELREAAMRQKTLLSLNSSCIGTITSIKPSKKRPDAVVIRMYLDNYKMPAISNAIPPSKAGKFPKAGDKARVKVVGFRPDGMVLVQFRGLHGAPNYTLV